MQEKKLILYSQRSAWLVLKIEKKIYQIIIIKLHTNLF